MLTKKRPLPVLQITYVWHGARLAEIVWTNGIGGRVEVPVPKHLESELSQVLASVEDVEEKNEGPR